MKSSLITRTLRLLWLANLSIAQAPIQSPTSTVDYFQPSIFTSTSYLSTSFDLNSGLISYISTASNGVPMWCGATVSNGTTSCVTVFDAVVTACDPASTVVGLNDGTPFTMPLCGPGMGPDYTPGWPAFRSSNSTQSPQPRCNNFGL